MDGFIGFKIVEGSVGSLSANKVHVVAAAAADAVN